MYQKKINPKIWAEPTEIEIIIGVTDTFDFQKKMMEAIILLLF